MGGVLLGSCPHLSYLLGALHSVLSFSDLGYSGTETVTNVKWYPYKLQGHGEEPKSKNFIRDS